MEELSIKSADAARWDCVSLGEVMLRLDPGEGRIHTVRQFRRGRAEGSTTWPAGCAAASACALPLPLPLPIIPSAGWWRT